MTLFNNGLINDYCDISIYKSGLKYYEQDYVTDLTYKDEGHRSIAIKSMVLSSNGYSEYLTKFIVNDKSFDISDYKCTCEQFVKKNKICKHIVASYLKFINEVNLNECSYLDEILKVYKKPFNFEQNIKKHELNLDITLFNTSIGEIQNFVQLKVGIDKLYIVKSMRDFLKAYYFKQPLFFGKNFILDFKKAKFSKNDSEILDLFVQMLEIEESLTSLHSSIVRANKQLVTGKKVYLIDSDLKRFLKLIGNKSFTLVLPIGEYQNVRYIENCKIEFSIEKEGNNILLYHKDNNLAYPLTRDVSYFYYNGNVCSLRGHKRELYEALYKSIIESKGCKLTIDESHKGDFASFVFPKLKSFAEIEIKDDLAQEFYKEELKTEIYLDKEGESVSLKIIFIYGDIEINPCEDENLLSNKGILIRDAEQELEILNLINMYDFKQRKNDFILSNEENIVNFLVKGLEIFQNRFQVFYSDSFKSIRVHDSKSYKCSLRINKEDMLEFSFDIKNVDKNELINIFEALREKKKYYKLSNGDIVLLNEKFLKSVGDIIEYLDISPEEYTKEVIKLPKYNSLYIEQKLNDLDTYISKNKEFINVVSSLKEVKDMDYAIPIELDDVLRSYQKIGFKWFKTLSEYGFGGILADEMGLGKTLQTIAFLTSERGMGTSLIICPTSLVYNWKEEIEKFSNKLKVLIFNGNKEDRKKEVKNFKNYDVVITSYPLVRRDIELYRQFNFLYCILDEAQQIKNPVSQNALSIKEIQAKNKFALTGTPVENNLSELWSIFDFIMPAYLLNHNKFYSRYEVPICKDKNEDTNKELAYKIRPFILRRLKKDVIKELPPKIYNNILVDMSYEQKRLYMSYVKGLKNEIQEEVELKGINQSRFKILSALTRLRQICCDPSVFIQNYIGGSGKLEFFYELVENCVEEGHKVLVFSQFTSVLKNIAYGLKNRGIRYLYLDGAIKSEERMRLVRKFNEGCSEVFLISLKAGGSGLNLTSADVVIHFDPWWNPAVEEQATDRAHRIGQKNTVQVIKLVSRGTIEEKILNLQEKKKKIIENVIGDEALTENLISYMTIEEIMGLFTL